MELIHLDQTLAALSPTPTLQMIQHSPSDTQEPFSTVTQMGCVSLNSSSDMCIIQVPRAIH
jgi:hypothetical protein